MMLETSRNQIELTLGSAWAGTKIAPNWRLFIRFLKKTALQNFKCFSNYFHSIKHEVYTDFEHKNIPIVILAPKILRKTSFYRFSRKNDQKTVFGVFFQLLVGFIVFSIKKCIRKVKIQKVFKRSRMRPPMDLTNYTNS